MLVTHEKNISRICDRELTENANVVGKVQARCGEM